MANTATVYARIDPKLKTEVEAVLTQLGITSSSLIQMLYSEIKLTKRVPSTLSIPSEKPLSLGSISREEFDFEFQKGVDDMSEGRVRSLDELDIMLKKECGI